ncbi:DUF3188 domain-containing protein [Prochlorococcus sp. MIT 1307]|uniref:DUF3188 domain-containing protein n=1 Tax=Prochlorococcus sp. MIT 1307 TaxID=3096219 RepID=UPI002A751C2F|nr:DUF3188 domain-containing protein [Prochlorococcus sp. MIT 1307]
MKNFHNRLLSLSAPCLILISILGLFQREGSERLQSLPALLAGVGLIISGALERRNRRKKLLLAIRNRNQPIN